MGAETHIINIKGSMMLSGMIAVYCLMIVWKFEFVLIYRFAASHLTDITYHCLIQNLNVKCSTLCIILLKCA